MPVCRIECPDSCAQEGMPAAGLLAGGTDSCHPVPPGWQESVVASKFEDYSTLRKVHVWYSGMKGGVRARKGG
jgi:hypothetical protein